MKKLSSEELKKIIEDHQHWLKQDCKDWEEMRADLSYTDLRGMNLSNVILIDANLSHADLSEADLKEANLSNAHLSDANLKYALLFKATFVNADLSKANLIGANLYQTVLRCANLREADLINAKLWEADLSEANLSKANLSQASLSGANLSNVKLIKANLTHTGLNNVNLTNADLSEAYLNDTNLNEANLSNANFSKVNLTKADVSVTDLRDNTISKYLQSGKDPNKEFVFAYGLGYNPVGKIVGTTEKGLYNLKETIKAIDCRKSLYGLCVKEGYYILENLKCCGDGDTMYGNNPIPKFLTDFSEVDDYEDGLDSLRHLLNEEYVELPDVKGTCLAIKLEDYLNLDIPEWDLIDSILEYNIGDCYTWLLSDSKTKSLIFVKAGDY